MARRASVVSRGGIESVESLELAEYVGEPAANLRVGKGETRGLQPVTLPALLGESHFYTDLCLAFGARSAPPPTFVSTVKIRQAGFTEAVDTEASVCGWLQDLIDRRILPRG